MVNANKFTVNNESHLFLPCIYHVFTIYLPYIYWSISPVHYVCHHVLIATCWYQFIHLVIVVKLPYSSCHLTWGSDNELCWEFLSIVVCATVEYKSPLCILAVIYLQCMKLCLAKGIIIPFAYNSSERGFGHKAITPWSNLTRNSICCCLCSYLFTAALL